MPRLQALSPYEFARQSQRQWQPSQGLHPRVYGLLIGLVLWLALSVWLFAAGGTVDYLHVIVSYPDSS